MGTNSFSARNELSMLFPYTSSPAGNELILKLTKNTASEIGLGGANLHFSLKISLNITLLNTKFKNSIISNA
jgi:hypothetical protein